MKSRLRRTLCTLLALIMLVGVCGISAFADDTQEPVCQYKYYTVLGDSIASAYGTDGYDAALKPGQDICDGNYVPESYAAIVGEAIGAETIDMRSHSGWRTFELLNEIGYGDLAAVDTMYGSYYNSSFFRRALNYISDADLAGESERIINAITSADFITLNIGTNDLFSYAIAVTANKCSEVFENSGILNIEDMQGIEDLVAAFNRLLSIASKEQYKGIITEFVSAIENGFAIYKKNMPVLIDKIQKMNPEAKLVVIGMSNPANITIDLADGIGIDPYMLSDLLMTRANTFTKGLCREKGCMFVDMTGTEYYGIGVLDTDKLLAGDESVKYSAIKIVHPNKAGHAFMAQQILTALKSETAQLNVTGRYSTYIKRNTLNWNKIDGANRYCIYRSCSHNGNYYFIGSTDKDVFYDYATMFGHTYYYKVCAFMNPCGSIRTPFSEAVALRAR